MACGLALVPGACAAYDHGRYGALVDGRGGLDVAPRSDAAPDAADGLDAFDAADAADVPAPTDAVDAGDAPIARDVVPTCPARAVSNYCAQSPALDRAPTIDGVLDCGLTIQHLPPALHWSRPPPPPAGLDIQFATAWRADGLYVFVHVLTPRRTMVAPLYCGDAVELFFDSDGMYTTVNRYDMPGTRQFIIAAPPTGTDHVLTAEIWAEGLVGPWTSTQYVSLATPDGYVVEAFLTALDLGLSSIALGAGGVIGFDLEVDFGPQGPTDASACGAQLGQAALSIGTPRTGCADGRASCNTSAFCAPALLAP